MKNIMTLCVALCFHLFISPHANAGILGDVNNDGNIDLTEAVHAMQVTAGIRSAQSVSYAIVWKGAWTANQDYQLYDAVQINGSSYICKEPHRAGNANQPPSAQWDIMAVKGTDGAAGVIPDLTPLLARISQLESYTMPSAFVSNSEGNTVSPINLITCKASSEIPVGMYPSGIARHPGGRLVWVANTNSNSLSVIDALSNTVIKTIAGNLGNPFQPIMLPQSVVFNPSATRVYIGGRDFIALFNAASMKPIVSRQAKGTVTNLSLSSTGALFGLIDGDVFAIPSVSTFWDPAALKGTLISTTTIASEAILAMATVAGSDLVYTADHGVLALYEYGTKSVFLKRYSVPLNNHGVATGIAVNQASETAYVLAEDGVISVVDTNDFTLTKNIDIRRLIDGFAPREAKALYMSNASGSDLLYIVLNKRSSVAVIDPAAETLVAEIRVGFLPTGIGGP